jgi:hypothetical protein
MLKKFTWIVALFAALTMVFFGCTQLGIFPDDEDEGALVLTTVFQFSLDPGIQELPVGPLTFGSGDAGNPIKPLVRAAEDAHASYEIIKVDGKNALKYVTHATWGPGFDLPNKVFGFKAGDKITVVGKAEGAPIDLAWNKNQGGSQQIVGERITAVGEFEIEVELTADDVASILGNEQAVLRFEDRAGETTVTITEIIIEGMRASNIKALPAPAISLDADGKTLSWAAIEGAGGYDLYAGDTKVLTLGATATSVNLQVALNGQAEGAKSVTLIAVGIPGSSSSSAASNAVAYTHTNYSVAVTIKVDGTDTAAFVKLFGGTANFEALTATANAGYKVTGGHDYSNSFPYIEVDLGTTTKLSGIASVEFTAKGASGDVTYKRFQVSVAEAAAIPSFSVLTRKSSNRWEGATDAAAGKTFTLAAYDTLIKDSGIKDTAAAAKTVLAFSLNPSVAASAVYTIEGIEITTGTPSPDEVISAANLDIALAAPVTGQVPVKEVSKADSGENPVYTGTVRWAPSASAFESFDKYTATIILTPAKTYKMPTGPFTTGDVKVNGVDASSGAVYSTGLLGVTYTFPQQTLVLGPLGLVYDLLADPDLADLVTNSGNTFINLANAATPVATFTMKASNPLATTKSYLEVTTRGLDWHGVHILKASDFSAFSYGRKHTIKVQGKVPSPGTGTTAATQFILGRQGGDYSSYGTGALAADGTFTAEVTLTWANISDGINIRLSPGYNSGWTLTTVDYDIYNITITAVAD